MNTAIHPFLNSVADCIEAILVTIHNEDFSQYDKKRTRTMNVKFVTFKIDSNSIRFSKFIVYERITRIPITYSKRLFQ